MDDDSKNKQDNNTDIKMEEKKQETEEKKDANTNEVAESDGIKILNEVFGKAEIST